MEVEPEVYENPYIYGSPLHLSRAMMNIYSNCIKYNKENGEIRTHVRLLHSDEKYLHISGRSAIQELVSVKTIWIGYLNRLHRKEQMQEVFIREPVWEWVLQKHYLNRWEEILKFSVSWEKEAPSLSHFLWTGTGVKDNGYRKTEKESIQDIKILLAEDNELNQEVARILLEEEGAKVFV